jgi:hypothetical protein
MIGNSGGAFQADPLGGLPLAGGITVIFLELALEIQDGLPTLVTRRTAGSATR